MRVWLLFFAACSGRELPRELADIGVEVLDPVDATEDEVRIYEVGAVGPDTVVYPFSTEFLADPADVDEELENEDAELAPSPIDQNATLYLVDWAPDAAWSHPTTWVWLDANGSVLHTEVHAWFPIVDNVPFYPNQHQPVWGVPDDDVDPPGNSVEVLPAPRRGAAPATDGDPTALCPDEGAKVAVSLTTWDHESTRKDVELFNGLHPRHRGLLAVQPCRRLGYVAGARSPVQNDARPSGARPQGRRRTGPLLLRPRQ